jgi:hypothetical protein
LTTVSKSINLGVESGYAVPETVAIRKFLNVSQLMVRFNGTNGAAIVRS